MFLLPRRQIWTQQPQALTGIDRSDSITRDLCFVQSGGLDDIFTNVGTTQKPTTRGVVRSFDAALSQYLFANNNQVVGPALTLFALFSVNNLTSNLALIGVGGPASSRHLLYVAPEGVAAMFSGEGVPYGQAQSAPWTLSDTAQYYFSVGRVSANNSRDIWVNGKQVASDSTSVAVSPANIDRVAIGAYWNNGAPVAGLYFDGNIALSGAYSRALSDDEIVVLSANPWKIFKRPDSRIFVPVSVGGGPTNITGILLSTLDSITTAIQGSLGHSGTLSISLDTIAVTGNGVLNHIGTSSSTLDGVVITFSGAVDTAGSVSGTLACTLDSIVFSGAGNLNHSTTISITLDDVFVSLAGTVAGTPENIDGTLSIVLDGIGFTSSGNSGTLTLTEDDINAIMTAIINNPKTLTIPKFLGLK